MKLDRISVASIDFASGVLRGVIGSGVVDSDWIVRRSKLLIDGAEESIMNLHAAARYIERLQREQARREYQQRKASAHPQAIPCRMCQAGPGYPCKYKGASIARALGGHAKRTPRHLRRYHKKRVADAQQIQAQA